MTVPNLNIPGPNDEQRMLAETLARYLADQYPHQHRMEFAASAQGYQQKSYAGLCDLGIAAALLPDTVGGYGGNGADIATVFEELGRALVTEPFLSSAVLGGGLLADIAPDTQATLISEIMQGNKTVALAHYEPGARYCAEHILCTATPADNGWILNGEKNQIYHTASANYFIVSALTSTSVPAALGTSLFLIDSQQPGLTANHQPTIDGYQTGAITLDHVAVSSSTLLGQHRPAFDAIEKTIARGVLALCAEAVGAMSVCKEMTIEYLQTRKQFGTELGKFQVLQHRMVDAVIELEQARSAVLNAAAHLDHHRDERELQISAAKNLIGRTSQIMAEECIQLHGGIAMTWEYPLSHYAKRLIMIDHMLGDTDYHLQRFIEFSNIKRDNATTT